MDPWRQPPTNSFFGNPFAQGTLGNTYYEANPESAYTYMMGLGTRTDPRAQYQRRNYGTVRQAYEAELPFLPVGSPESTFLGYLQRQRPQLEQSWQNQSPRARGLNYSAFAGPVRSLL